jgi:formylglycine-generating enzyme required for sulfatase activity
MSWHARLRNLFLLLIIGLMAGAASPLSSDLEGALKPGDVFAECDGCPEMVVVPAGEFYPNGRPSAADLAAHPYQYQRVDFPQPFAVGRFAVTFAEWDACVADGGCGGYRPGDEGWGRGRRPVIHVSFDDATAYTMWLSRKTGKRYRLLTGAEREYVTRAATETNYWWGNTITPDQANYNGDYPYYDDRASASVYRRKTMPVDAFAPNPWGLYQVHGNVWEWVDACTIDEIRRTHDCELRGGSWASKPAELTPNVSEHNDPGFRGIVGFRVARSL